jgi:hypothetical protein
MTEKNRQPDVRPAEPLPDIDELPSIPFSAEGIDLGDPPLDDAELLSHEKDAAVKYSHTLPLKPEPKYGACLWWPENGTDWIHPHDVPKAEDFVPGHRVMLRTYYDDEYSLLTYGDLTVRVRPVMWLPVDFEGFKVGDVVETRSHMGRNEAFVATIHEMTWNDREKRIEYGLARSGRIEHRKYLSDDIMHTEKLDTAVQSKKLQ